ncbi:MAG TPA: hypothetical protein VK388_17860 [Pyrinomonadaceae bacterium]|nr:hypothetical protein [Pyrinomonadaceae bacterium]
MSTLTLNEPLISPILRGTIPISLPLPGQDSNLSLHISAPGVSYKLEAPLVDSPIIEDNKIVARFIVDANVYLDLTLTGQSLIYEERFKYGQFSLFYNIEERRPRAHFVADTLMAVMGLAGRLELKISEPEVSTNLNFDFPLLEISKMLHRRQTAYRLMVIEKATGKQFLLPSTMTEGEVGRIAFVYHAIVDRSFIWSGRSFEGLMPATQQYASLLAQPVQPSIWAQPIDSLSETILGQQIDLGHSVISMEDAVIESLDEIREQLKAGDGRQIALKIRSLSGQNKYEFIEAPYLSDISWEPKIQALIDLEPYLDAAIVDRYHGLAASTLAGLTEEEKKEVTTFPDLDEAFMADVDGE